MLSDRKICAVIMAGGKGTRISCIDSDLPKPMLSVTGKPILEYQIENLARQGIVNIFISIGYLGSEIKEYFGDGSGLSPITGKPYGVKIEYIQEDEPLGTAGALFYLRETIQDDFLLINGDLIFDIDIQRFYEFHKRSNTSATIFIHPNDHPYDSGIIISSESGLVTDWLHREDERQWYRNRVNAGLHFLSPEIFKSFEKIQKRDLDRDILKPMIGQEKLSAYYSPEYVKDVGTPERLKEVEGDIRSGRVAQKNLSEKQKAVFLDRDGTINKYIGFLTDINEFELIGGVAQAIKKINESGYLAIVITNQPVIARGDIDWAELTEIDNKMETLLGQEGAYIDDIFICPHHPDRGFIGERVEYKIECDCRKPKPGLLLHAAEKYNIDLSQSWMIGDRENDVLAGLAAGCKVGILGGASLDGAEAYHDLQTFVDANIGQMYCENCC